MSIFPELSVLLSFLSACFVLQASPGPDMMMVVNNSVSRGTKAGLLTVMGIFFGFVIQAPLLVFGTVSLMTIYDHAFDVLRAAGATYLGYLAYRNFRNAFATDTLKLQSKQDMQSNPISEGFITNVSNPKVLLFLFAFIPQFTVFEKGQLWLQLLIFLTILKLNGILVNGSVALVSSYLSSKLEHRSFRNNWSSLLSGIVFLIIAVIFWFQILTT